MLASLLASVAAYLPAYLTGGLAVQMQDELGFGATALGVAIGSFFAIGALTSSSVGGLVDRTGAARSLRWAAALSGIVLAGIAGLAQSYAVLLALMLVGGVASAWSQPAANVFLVRVVPPQQLGLALGIQKSSIPASALLGGLAVPVFALTVGWRWAFVAGAAFALVSVVQVPGQTERTPAHGKAAAGTPDVATRYLMVLALGVGLGSAASNALSAFLVLSAVDTGLGEGTAGVLLTVGSIAGIVVRLVAGARADRVGGSALATISVMFLLASGAYALLATGVGWVFVLATPLAFATAYAWPGLFHLAVVRSNPSAPGAATGIAMTGTLAGAVSGPIVFGAVVEAGGFTWAWLVGATFLLVAAVVVGSVRHHVREQLPTRPAITLTTDPV